MSGFANAVVGGAEFLIRSAIKSANYIATVSGWRIAKDGSAEFSNGTFRGTIIVGGNTITLDSTGIHIIGASHRWDMDANNGFISRRIPDDGTRGQIFDAGFFMRPQTPEPNTGATINVVGQLFAANNFPFGGSAAPYVSLVSPTYTGKAGNAGLSLQGQSQASAVDNSIATLIGAEIDLLSANLVKLNANEIDLLAGALIKLNAVQVIPGTDDSLQDTRHHYYLRGENQLFSITVPNGSASVVVPVTFTHSFSRAPMVVCNINDPGGQTAKWICRAIQITATGFNYWVQSPTGTATGAASNIDCTWVATEYTP